MLTTNSISFIFSTIFFSCAACGLANTRFSRLSTYPPDSFSESNQPEMAKITVLCWNQLISTDMPTCYIGASASYCV